MTKPTRNAADSFETKGDGNLAYIDMLRGLAILGVLLVHSTMGMPAVGLEKLPMHIEYLMMAGKHGVALFFVVSAFTLTRSMHIRIDKEHMPMRKYLLRRFFRIAPAYYFVLLVVFIFYGYGVSGYTNPQDTALTWTNLVAHLLFVNGFFPYYTNDFLGVEWSVSTEFMFYMLLPFLFLWLHKTSTVSQAIIKIGLLYLGSIVIVFLWRIFSEVGYLQALGGGFTSPVFDAWRYFFIATHLPEFAAGMAVWSILKLKARNFPSIETGKAKLLLVLAVIVFSAIAGAYVEGGGHTLNNSTVVSGGLLLFWGLSSAGLILCLNSLQPANVGGLRLLTGLGRVSFSLYLVHFPIFYGLSRHATMWRITQIPEVNFLLYEITVFGLAYFLARLLFHFVEKPGMELGRVLLNRFPAQKNIFTEGVL